MALLAISATAMAASSRQILGGPVQLEAAEREFSPLGVNLPLKRLGKQTQVVPGDVGCV